MTAQSESPIDIQSRSIEIRGGILARNTLLNFIGQAVPLLVGVVTIPFIVHGLGADRFGLLSLAWVILAYFSIFDLGLGRATTKYVAEALAKGEDEQVPRIVWTAVTVQAILGLLGCLFLVGFTPFLVQDVLKVPAELEAETKVTFYLIALSISVVLVSNSFSGVLEAGQRFDLINAVRIPSSVSAFIVPLVGLALGFQLPGIVALILIARFMSLLALIVFAVRVYPGLKKFSASFPLFLRLFRYGGWITVSSVAGPILLYSDRFLIGSFLSMATVSYYTAPFEVIIRLWIIPGSLVMTLFPAFSTFSGLGQYHQTQDLLLRTTKYLLIAVTPITFVVISFAGPMLEIWLGSDFAQNSTLTFQILAIGALVGVLAPLPGAILHGYGRPDVIAKLYLAYIPLNVFLVIILIKTLGLPGAALSFTLRSLLDTVLLFIIALRITHQSWLTFLRRISRSLGMVMIAGVLLFFALWVSDSIFLRGIFTTGIITLFVYVVWRWIFNEEDKSKLKSSLKGTEWQGIKQN